MASAPAVATGGAAAAPTPTPAPAPAEQTGATRKIAPIPPKAAASTPDEKTKDDGPDAVVHKADAPTEAQPDARPKRTSLPGVFSGDDVPDLPVRGPDGKFISRQEAARLFDRELAGDDEPDDGVRIEGDEPPPAKAPTQRPTPPGQGGKVTFLGREYENIGQVEQMYRSLQGMHDPIAKKLAQAEKDRDYGYTTANQWEQVARDAQAKLEQYEKSGRRPAEQPAAAKQGGADDALSLDSLVDGINYDAFEAIAHDPKGGTRVAGRYLAQQLLNTVVSTIVPALRTELMKEISPVRDSLNASRADVETANRVTSLINDVASYTNLRGEPAFPELNDEGTLAEIAATWRESGLPPAAALTPAGLIQAIGLYRMMKSLPDGSDPTATPGSAPVVPGPEIVAMAEGGDGAHTGLGRAPEPGHLGPEAKMLRRSLDDAPLFDKNLGFAVNRRR